MNTYNKILTIFRTYLIKPLFIIIFLITLIINIPAWVLNSQIIKYSKGVLTLDNVDGTFWNGSGLLVATSHKGNSAPLKHITWNINLGISKYVDIKFYDGDHTLAEAYIDNNGINVDKLDVNLSIIQVSQLIDVTQALELSGNFHIMAEHLNINKHYNGLISIDIKNISSGLSPINPLGSYALTFDLSNNVIAVTTMAGAVLKLIGSGSFNNLVLNASINPSNINEMRTFITIMGMPNADGSYNLKIF